MKDISYAVKHIKIEDYDYPLEEERIAKFPVEPRDNSKLLVYRKGKIYHTVFKEIPQELPGQSTLVYNNTKVIHARLMFQKETGAKIEIFCLEPNDPSDYALNFASTKSCEWKCLIGNSKKWKQGPVSKEIIIKNKTVIFNAEKKQAAENAYIVNFSWKICNNNENLKITFADILEEIGKIPIPPYLKRDSQKSDETSYQTVYSKIDGSVAAPTAGLHFTPEVLKNIDKKDITKLEVTLHVGAGTFKPVQCTEMEDHIMHHEFISVKKETIKEIIKKEGSITAVGTTSVRTLESLFWFGHKIATDPNVQIDDFVLNQWYPYEEGQKKGIKTKDALEAIISYLEKNDLDTFTASTQLIIAPGYDFKVINNIITNFHQPKSTLLLLVSAFLKGEEWKKVYKYALENDFRFLSYGDSSLLIR